MPGFFICPQSPKLPFKILPLTDSVDLVLYCHTEPADVERCSLNRYQETETIMKTGRSPNPRTTTEKFAEPGIETTQQFKDREGTVTGDTTETIETQGTPPNVPRTKVSDARIGGAEAG